MKNFRNSFLFFIFGIFFALFLLEISLISFNFLVQDSTHYNFNPYNSDIILGLGNSHMAGTGAPKGEDYISNLEKIMHENYSNYHTINKGVTNMNSYQILVDLEENIIKFNPKIIILQTGSPNLWNPLGFDSYKNNLNKNISTDNILIEERKWYNFRFIDFFKYMFIFKTQRGSEISQQNFNFSKESIEKNSCLSNRVSDEIVLTDFKEFYNENNYSKVPYTSNEINNKKFELKSKINSSNYTYDVVDMLSLSILYFYEGDYDSSIQYYNDLLDYAIKNSDFNRNRLIREYDEISLLLQMVDFNFIMIRDKLDKIDLFFDYFKINQIEEYEKIDWALSDIEKIYQICEKNDIELVILNYPPRYDSNKEAVEILNKRISEFAKEKNLNYLDLNTYFKDLWANENKSNYLVEILSIESHHLNEYGNKLVSNELYEIIFEN